jgi:chorismate mutase
MKITLSAWALAGLLVAVCLAGVAAGYCRDSTFPVSLKPMKTLEDYRAEIDVIDEQMVDLLVKRFDVVHAVGELKARENIAVVQSARAQAVKDRVAAMAQARGLDGDLLRAIYTLIIDHAHKVEWAKEKK